MRYAGLIKNDIVNGEGVCVSLFTQGCPHRCAGCHNPETWSFNGGIEIEKSQLILEIINSIKKNNFIRNFSILGGEPLCPQNLQDVIDILTTIRTVYPSIKIFLWTGYNYETFSTQQKEVFKYIDVLIDGEYKKELRDISLPLRGSSNQRILRKENNDF